MTCASFFSLIPPTLVISGTIFSYYSYVLHFCVYFVTCVTKKSLYLFFYHIFFIMYLWSFLQTACQSHYPVPDEYRLSPSEHAKLLTYTETEANNILKKLVRLRHLELHTCGPNGRHRYCKHCMLIKPDRTHHCSTCDKCVLKMDHHCPWVLNCVGFANYKQFILMLFYCTLWCTFYTGTVAEFITEIWKDIQSNLSKLLVGTGFILSTFLGMFVVMLFAYHVKLVFKNETTIEALREVTFQQDNSTYDLGKWVNFTEVFGDNACCWLIPVKSGKGNGHEFPVNRLIP